MKIDDSGGTVDRHQTYKSLIKQSIDRSQFIRETKCSRKIQDRGVRIDEWQILIKYRRKLKTQTGLTDWQDWKRKYEEIRENRIFCLNFQFELFVPQPDTGINWRQYYLLYPKYRYWKYQIIIIIKKYIVPGSARYKTIVFYLLTLQKVQGSCCRLERIRNKDTIGTT